MTTRWVLGALLFGGLLVLDGCGGSGQYRIPTVDPVVKQKSSEDEDLLKELEGPEGSSEGTSSKAPSPKATGKETTPPKPEAETAPAAETPSKTETKAGAKAAESKTEPAKPKVTPKK